MTKDELKGVIKSNVYAWHNYDAILAAVEQYSSALIAAKPIVSGQCSGCDWIDIDYKVRKCVKCGKSEQFD